MPPAQSSPQGRSRIGRLAPWLIAMIGAALLSGIVAADRTFVHQAEYSTGQPAPYTLRVSPLQPSPLGADGGAIIVSRGEVVNADQAAFAASQRGMSTTGGLALFFTLFVLVLAWSSYLRTTHWGAQRKRQLVALGTIVTLALVMRALFLLTSLSILAAPAALVGLMVSNRSGRGPALATGALTAMVMAAMVPFDVGIAAALLAQALLVPLLLRRNAGFARVLLALVAAGAASAITYAVAYAAFWNGIPSIADPLRSTWLASFLAVGIAGAALLVIGPVFEWLTGEVSRRRLSNLERLSQPLLRQISSQAPGTWQHSLAMAKLANGAGIAIGADLQLLRVGAYYHDLGKSVAPKYFVENLGGGESSVHENLKPTASRDAIFAHVSEGVRLATSAGLPNRIIDFIRSHHCAAPLEYFWTIEQAQTPPSRASLHEFCYPGSKPQCRETGIMCVVDAVEGASRSLKSPAREEVESLVHQIVYGKLRAGQLDESGLSLSDIQKIDAALSHSLNLAHTPEASRHPGADAIATAVGRPKLQESLEQAAAKLALLSPVRLDSLDLPRAGWQGRPTPASESPFGPDPSMAFVETEAVSAPRAVSESDIAEEADTQQDEDASTAKYEGSKAAKLRGKLALNPMANEVTSTTDHLRTRERPAEIVPDDRTTMPRDAEAIAEENRMTAPRSAQDPGPEDRVTAPRPAQDPEDRVTAPRPAQDPEDRVTAPRPALDPEDRVTAPRPALDPDMEDTAAIAKGTRRTVQPVQGHADHQHEEPLLLESPIRGRQEGKEAQKQSDLGRWNEALTDATMAEEGGPPTPPPGAHHGGRATIPLGKDELQVTPAPASTSRPSKRADSNDGMKPGEMVIGAPPATHPERTLHGIMPREDVTAEHFSVPDEARRPEDRITEETEAVVPPDAYPETISAPGPVPRKPKGDDEI